MRSTASAQIKPGDLYTLADRLEAQAVAHAERSFLIYGGQSFSYAQVDRQANRMAQVFYDKGLRPGDVCAIAMENRPQFFFSWFGLVKLGAVVAFINTQVSGKPLTHALVCTAAKAIVVGEECLANLLATEGLPDVPLWLIEDPENPFCATLPPSVDQTLEAHIARVPDTAFPRDCLLYTSPSPRD